MNEVTAAALPERPSIDILTLYDYLNQIELFRSDAAKEARKRSSQTVIEMHNAASR